MSIGHYLKTVLLIGGVTLLQAESTDKPFEVESGMVIYKISGGAQLTPETHLTIEGEARLRFRDWGDVKLEEESGTVLTSGAIKHKQHVQRLEKQTKDTIITTDFVNEQLLERKKGSRSRTHDQTAALTKTGQESVAGLLCDVWEGPGIKKCIYKNIVLKLESHVLDVSYVKEATEASFDINVSADQCEVPDFPVRKFALFKDDIKTKNVYKTENLCKVLKDVAFEISEDNESYTGSNIDEDERRKFINYIAKDIYKKQKKLLPVLLQSLKETRACLQTGENPFEANQCIENFSRMKVQLGTQEDDYIILWDEKRKNTLLDKIEEDLIDLQSRMPCIKRAKNITDLSSCMK